MNNYETGDGCWLAYPSHISCKLLKIGRSRKMHLSVLICFGIRFVFDKQNIIILKLFLLKKKEKSILKYPIYMHFSRLQNSALSFIVPSCRMRPFGRTINYLEVLLQIHNFNLMLRREIKQELIK